MRSQEFAMGEAVSGTGNNVNDPDPNFGRSSLRLSWFYSPNFGDYQKKILKKGLQPG